MRHSYVFEGIDYGKVVENARKISKGDNRNDPEPVLVHMHRSTQACNGQHRYFKDGEESTEE